MNLKSNQRGFVLVEFVIALPLLILLLYAFGSLIFKIAQVSREQVANYTLESEAQAVIERISNDARSAHSTVIRRGNDFDRIIFMCHTHPQSKGFQDILDPRIYVVASPNGGAYRVYFKRKEDGSHNNPITGDNDFGNTFITQLKFTKQADRVLHITIEMESMITEQLVKFDTAVFMPACEEFLEL